jgi:hypothetical protein
LKRILSKFAGGFADSGFVFKHWRRASLRSAHPYKKSKCNPLTDEQKLVNKQFAKERIFIEPSISGLKRFRVLSDRLRIHDIDLYGDILDLCAGLWNFYLTN